MPIKLKYDGTDYQDEIVSGSGGLDMSHAMVGETLSVDALTVSTIVEDKPVRIVAADQDENGFIISDDDEILCIVDGVPIPEFVKNGVGELYFNEDLLGAYYCEELKQAGPHEHIIRFLSGIRLLDRSDHPGGLYSGETAGEVIADIIGDIVPYTIDEGIAEIPIYNYLPYARRRDNLRFVLLAIGAAIKNNPDGSLRITQLSDTVTGVFDASRVFIGGTVKETTPVTAVQVTEHNYLPSEEEIILYDSATVDIETIKFDEPAHDLQITGGTIISSGVNYCTFQGEGYVHLKGKRYNHVTRVITVGTPPTGIDSDVVKKVTNNTLLGPNNAVFVAEKLYDYLSVSKIIRQEVVLGSERPADVVQVLHPYTREMVEACIKSMKISFGKTESRALCEFLVGYKPPGITTGFENHVVLDGAGSWTVPEGITKIRAILVGAGENGENGERGGNTTGWSTSTPVNVGQGGAGGEGGNGGLILEININVTPGMPISFNCGESNGEATVFGGYSSIMGRAYPYGYFEPKSGLTIGKKGENGIDGRPGNSFQEVGEPIIYKDVTYNCGTNGSNYTRGGSYSGTAFGGGGGGAAVGGNGQNGKNGSEASGGSPPFLHHGDGGNGASAIAGDDATEYGQGGGGGHGGGGGGYEIGKLSINNYNSPTPPYSSPIFDLPKGGAGGAGGSGGPGCIIVYY